jgi:hypothetical protein
LVASLLKNLKISIFRVTTVFSPEIKSIFFASKVLKINKNKKEVKNDLLFNMAPPLGLEPRTL